MARLGSIVAVAIALSLCAPASADYGRLMDPAGDVQGGLDIADLIFSHRNSSGEKKVSHLVSMHRSWKPSMLHRRNRVIHLLFDTVQDAGYENYSFVTERRIEIFFARGKLRAKMYNNLGDPPKFITNVRVRRSGSKGVYVVVPLRDLSRRRLSYYEWAFMTVFSRRGHQECPLTGPCVDKVGKYIRHDL